MLHSAKSKSKIVCMILLSHTLISVSSAVNGAEISKLEFDEIIEFGIDEKSVWPQQIFFSNSALAESPLLNKLEAKLAVEKVNNQTRHTRAIRDFPENGIRLGEGWNSLTGEKTNSLCLDMESESSRTSTGGQKVIAEHARIMDTNSLRKEMGVSTTVEAKASFGDVGGGSVSYKREFIRKSFVSRSNLNLLVKAQVTNGITYVSPSNVTGQILFNKNIVDRLGFDPLAEITDDSKTNREAFYKLCGDSYVESIERGAELFALYQFDKSKERNSTENNVGVTVEGNYAGFGGSASSNTRKFRETINTSAVSSINYHHSAHPGLFIPHDEESLNTSLQFLGSAQDPSDAFPYKIRTVKYANLPGWKFENLSSEETARNAWVKFYSRLADLKKILIDVRHNPENYILDDASELLSVYTLESNLDIAMDWTNSRIIECELEKMSAKSSTARDSVIDRCNPKEYDLMFSDYQYRALMPIPTVEVAGVGQNEIAKITTELQAQYNLRVNQYFNQERTSLFFRIDPPLTCARAYNAGRSSTECRTYRNRFYAAKNALDSWTASTNESIRANARYEYWIEEIAHYRELTDSEDEKVNDYILNIWRNDIGCQYGLENVKAKCTTPLISEMARGGVLILRKDEASNPTYETDLRTDWFPANDANGAFLAMDLVISNKAFEIAGGKPHLYDVEVLTYETKTRGANVEGKPEDDVLVSGRYKINVHLIDSIPLKKLTSDIVTNTVKTNILSTAAPLQ